MLLLSPDQQSIYKRSPEKTIIASETDYSLENKVAPNYILSIGFQRNISPMYIIAPSLLSEWNLICLE